MKQFFTISTLALALFYLAGCATSGTSPSQAAIPETQRIYWEDSIENSYTIKVTRDRGQMGSLCTTRIAIDDKHAADIYQGESVSFDLPAGSHVLSAWQISGGKWGAGFCDKNPMRLDVEVSGRQDEENSYRYSYAGSGYPSLAISSL